MSIRKGTRRMGVGIGKSMMGKAMVGKSMVGKSMVSKSMVKARISSVTETM